MVLFLARRTAYLVVLVAAVAVLSFALSAWTPGSFDAVLRLEPHYPGSAAAALRARHGLDRPVLDRIGRWVGSVARGNLGVSIEYDAPVAPLVLARASRTLVLGLAATSLAWVIAIPLGAWMAAREGSWGARACRAGLALALSLPEPAVALGLMLVAVRLGAAPAGGMLSARLDAASASSWQTLADFFRHLALPAVALATGLTPVLAGHVRSSLAETLRAPFIIAATARGVPAGRVLFRSALRAAAAPLVALFGLSVASLFSASLLVEVITGWPGLGPLLVEATRSRDVPVVIGVTLCSVLLLATGNLVTDIGMRLADPRARARTRPVTG